MERIVYDFYKNYYTQLFCEGGFSAFSYKLTHKLVEKNYESFISSRKKQEQFILKSSDPKLCILEVGAGQGEHFEYVKSTFSEYVCLDLFEMPKDWVYQNDERLLWVKGDISKLDFDGKKFDRIIVMCVLHHLKDPFLALKNMQDLLNDDGVLTFFLPSDPGVLNRMNRKIFVSPKAKKLGFSEYALVNAIEHQNHYWGLKSLVNSIFANYTIRKRYYPFNIPSANLSLFSIWNIQKTIKMREM